MASVFAYEPDPPRIASPWSATSPGSAFPHANDRFSDTQHDHASAHAQALGGLLVPGLARLEDYGLTALEPEPQSGPVEYKLHLLLRQRQVWLPVGVSDGDLPRAEHVRIRGARPMTYRDSASIPVASLQGMDGAGGGAGGGGGGGGVVMPTDTFTTVHTSSPPSYSTTSPQSRQQRLLHLTTQLLWRLKQSSPYHAFSAVDSIIPKLPDASTARLNAPTRPEKLLPGLEESQGAMYEIGVADDGCFVGLTRDEMDESLINLRAMAASLGCNVSIVRAVVFDANHTSASLYPLPNTPSVVGDRGSTEEAPGKGSHSSAQSRKQQQQQQQQQRRSLQGHRESLYVVEALVLPDTGDSRPFGHIQRTPLDVELGKYRQRRKPVSNKAAQNAEQLRVSLTGSTTSGKSTLVGTLLASTFDDARGKSRLNLLKHRHEIASGVTSSVAHELLGYHASGDLVVNYAYQNVDSWTDVHDTAEGGRLVLLTDSAGHPRFRRTIVRSLVAWQPHWTLCCIAAAYNEDAQPSETSDAYRISTEDIGPDAAQSLAIAHLELCLRLDLPLVVVITKYDLATRAGLKQTLSRILTILKAANRTPQLLKPSSPIKNEEELQTIPAAESEEVRGLVELLMHSHKSIVPIVLTSAVNGIGIGKLHALLRQLPVQQPKQFEDDKATEMVKAAPSFGTHLDLPFPSTMFDIDEIFVKDAQHFIGASSSIPEHDQLESKTYVLSGLLRRGVISVGETLLLGPFSTDATWRDRGQRPPLDMRRTASYPVTHHEMAMMRQAKIGARRRRSSEDVSGDAQSNRLALAVDAEANDSPSGPDIHEELDQAYEWLPVRVTSVRNLRLPVHSSFSGQCVTVGVSFPARSDVVTVRPRKGMVLAKISEREDEEAIDSSTEHDLRIDHRAIASCGAFQAIFPLDDYHVMEPGAQFNVYVGSIRALAKVVTVGLFDDDDAGMMGGTVTAAKVQQSTASELVTDFPVSETEQEVTKRELLGRNIARRQQQQQIFSLDEGTEDTATSGAKPNDKLEVMFQLVNNREYIEVGSKVFVMPGHTGEGSAALSGFVGRVTEVFA